MQIIYVDDSKAHQKKFQNAAKKIADISNVSIFDNIDAAWIYCQMKQVDLAFIELAIPESEPFLLVRQLQSMHIPFAFVSAKNRYTKEAFMMGAAHYLLKPIKTEDIEACLKRFRRYSDASITRMPAHTHSLPAIPARILVKSRLKTDVLNLNDILFLAGSGSYTQIKTTDGNHYISSCMLGIYATKLSNHPDFLRIHRSYIVNKRYVKTIRRKNRKHCIQLTDETELEISPGLKAVICSLLE